MPEKKQVQVGDEVEAMCTKCKAPTVHVVEVIKNDKVTKVMCKSCMSSHRYRKPETDEEGNVKKPTKTATKASTKTKEQRKLARVIKKTEEENYKDYNMSEAFTQNDVIVHDKFGTGVVLEVINPRKISVVFDEGVKTLIQNQE